MQCVRDVMATKLVTVTPSTSLANLERLLLEHRIGGVPVVEDGQLVGLVSRSDVVRALAVERGYAEQIFEQFDTSGPGTEADESERSSQIGARVGAKLGTKTVASVMVHDLITATPDQSLVSAAKALVEGKIHRLPVTDQGTLVGIISSNDLVKLVADGALTPNA
jgi:CBS domain-containing protein